MSEEYEVAYLICCPDCQIAAEAYLLDSGEIEFHCPECEQDFAVERSMDS